MAVVAAVAIAAAMVAMAAATMNTLGFQKRNGHTTDSC